MLDVEISKADGFGKTKLLDLAVYVKPTFQGAPLHHTSMHPRSVHVSWPLGRLHHFKSLCSDRGLFSRASVRFLERFAEFLPDQRIFDRLKVLHRELYQSDTSRTFAAQRSVGVECSWIVIPYHPALIASGFRDVFKGVQSDFLASGMPNFMPRLSWSRYCRNLREVCAGMIVQSL